MSRRRSSQAGTAEGFTLIELLVVMAIVTLLVAMLQPTLRSARGAARAVQCLSHQRHLGLMTMMYRDDFRGALPRPMIGGEDMVGISTQQQHQAVWYNALDAYMGRSVATTVSAREHDAWKHDPIWKSFSDDAKASNRTIKMNAYLNGDTVSKSDAKNPPHFTYDREIRRPALTVLFVDGQSADVHPAGSNDAHFGATPGRVALRHNDGANVTFVDGHGKHVRQPINDTLVVPGWFVPNDPRQEYVWRVDQ